MSALALLAACGPSTTPPGDGSGTGGSTSPEDPPTPTTGMLDASGGQSADETTTTGPSPGSTTDSTPPADGSSTGSVDPESCLRCPLGASSVQTEQGVTPSGSLALTSAAFGHESCGGAIVFTLATQPLDVDGELQVPGEGEGIQIWLSQSASFEQFEPYEGVYPAEFLDCASGYCIPQTGGELEFLEPFDPQVLCDPEVTPRVSARAEIHDQGWNLAVTFEATYCALLNACFCPCE